MNASDIIKAKQNKTLYKAYYTPTVYSSTIYSTLTAFSSITDVGGSVVSYTSCINTAYKTVCNPTFTSYETLHQIKDGAYDCGAASGTSLQFIGVPTTIYASKTNYITYTTAGGIVQPGSFDVTSTIASIPTGPVITPFITYQQGCARCNTSGCTNCLIGL